MYLYCSLLMNTVHVSHAGWVGSSSTDVRSTMVPVLVHFSTMETVLLICDLLLLEGQHSIHRMAVCILCRVYDFMCDVCTYHNVYGTCSTLNIARFMVAAV